jgi:hypothetical protein
MVINQVCVQPKYDGFAIYVFFLVNRGERITNTEGAQRALQLENIWID